MWVRIDVVQSMLQSSDDRQSIWHTKVEVYGSLISILIYACDILSGSGVQGMKKNLIQN